MVVSHTKWYQDSPCLGCLCGVFCLSVITEIIKSTATRVHSVPTQAVCVEGCLLTPQHYPEEVLGGQPRQGLAPVALAACRRKAWDPCDMQLWFKAVLPPTQLEASP